MKRFVIAVLLLLIALLFLWAAYLDGVVAFADYGVKIPDGAYGVFRVVATDTDSPLYLTHGVGQSIVDREDAACIRSWGEDGYAIFDHQGSEVGGGIWRVNEMAVGGSAFLFRADKPTKEYICTAIYLANSDGYRFIADVDKRNIKPKANDIICVSCAWEDDLNYVAYYKLVGELPE